MPGKVNPVIPEAATQAAMMAVGNDTAITMACASGNLELNAFLPLVAHCLLDSLDLLAGANDILARYCVDGIEVNEARCRAHVESSTATVTALLPALGYEVAGRLAREAADTGKTIRHLVTEQGLMSAEAFEQCISPEAVCRLGSAELIVNNAERPNRSTQA
jgi:aspartate ammonia-lyase